MLATSEDSPLITQGFRLERRPPRCNLALASMELFGRPDFLPPPPTRGNRSSAGWLLLAANLSRAVRLGPAFLQTKQGG